MRYRSSVIVPLNMLPHIHCYLQYIYLAWSQIGAAVSIGICYLLFCVGIVRLLKVKTLTFRDEWNKVMLLTGAFIFACGIGHFIDAITFFYPIYLTQNVWTWITALVSASALTAFVCFFNKLPKLQQTVAEAVRVAEENKALELELTQIRSFAEWLPQIAWTAQPDGYIDWYNHQWYEYTGMTKESAAGWGWKAAHDETMVEAITARWKESLETGTPFEMEFPLRGADGSFRTFLTRARPVYDEHSKIIRWFGTNTDIQAQILLQQKLMFESEMQARHLKAAKDSLESVRDLRVKMERHLDSGISHVTIATPTPTPKEP